MKLEDVKELQNIFKSNLNEVSKGKFKSKEQKKCIRKILNCFTNYGKLLLSYLMIILQLHLNLNANQNEEKD